MFPTFEQSGHQYGNQLIYVCLSPVGGTMLLFMTPERFKYQHQTKIFSKIPQGAGQKDKTRTPRSHSRVLISPPNDDLLSNHSVRRELLSDNVIRIDENVRVACQRVDGRGEDS